ncbi:hypothetical protein EV426DRAFT_583596 [Tirmania nivea]|nr:hypothetical protein EV426DRAFT_583596 [Tirmania nivea]
MQTPPLFMMRIYSLQSNEANQREPLVRSVPRRASPAVSDKLLRLLKVVQALPPYEYQALQHFIAVSPSTPSQTETIPIKILTFDLILVTFGLTYSESFYAYPRFHFIDIPHAGENDVLDTSLINYSCSGPLLRFSFLYQSYSPARPRLSVGLLWTKYSWRQLLSSPVQLRIGVTPLQSLMLPLK